MADLRPFAKVKNMLLETRKRDGTWVGTAVNPLVEDDHVYFRTWQESGKAKRLRNFAAVRIAPATASGKPTGGAVEGRATLLDGDEDEHARELIEHRYRLLQGVAVPLIHRLRRQHTQHYRITFDGS
jgi:PPOX class probable F420-dependent enzyme